MKHLKVAVNAKDHVQGEEDAACTLVEYGDFECPSCATAYPIVKKLQKHFGKKLKLVFRQFPLTEMHPYAEAAAEASEYAASEGKFWEMHDLLYENQDKLSDELFTDLSEELELDGAKLEQVLKAGKYEARVKADRTGGEESGVHGTPSFFIDGELQEGSFDYTTLVEAIEKQLGAART